MKAFVLDRYGKQRALQLTDVPVPALRDDEVLVAMDSAFHHLKLVLEPSGAVALAAALAKKLAPVPATLGVILSGGNIAIADFRRLTS